MFQHSLSKLKYLQKCINLDSIYPKNFAIIIAYTFLTIILTYPVAFKLGNFVPGWGDVYQAVYSLWYRHYAFFHPEITSLSHNYLLFYPEGIHAAFGTGVNQIPAIFLIIFMNPAIVYSILWLLSFILGAYGTYLLVQYLTKNSKAAFISGIIFAFSPYHFAHALGHMGATTIQWIPFFALFLMKMSRKNDIKYAVYAGIFFTLIGLSDTQYMVFAGLFAILVFIYELYINKSEKKLNVQNLIPFLKKYVVFGIVSFIGVLPLTYKDILIATSNENYLKPDPFDAIRYSTDLLSFILPSRLHPIFGDIVKPIYSHFSGNISEHTTFIGYTVIMLSIFVFLKLRDNKDIKFWLITAFGFSLISLGPILSINGKTTFSIFNATIPLPHIILYYTVPFLENCRTTGRFFVIASLAFAVLAGYGISEIMKSSKLSENRKKLFAIIILLIVIFEYLSIPFPISYLSQPDFYEQIALEEGNFALLEIPATTNYAAGVKVEYFQTIHAKPIIGGQVARTPDNVLEFIMDTPFIRELTYLRTFEDILQPETAQIGNSVLNYYNIKYVVLHTDYLNENNLKFAMDLTNSTLGQKPVIYEDDEMVVYKIESEDEDPFMSISDRWHGVEKWNDIPTRWMSNNGSLEIYSFDNDEYSLNLSVESFRQPRTLQIYTNDELVSTTIVPTDFTNLNVPVLLKKGDNHVVFYTVEGTNKPSEFGSGDSRDLSLAFQNISVYKMTTEYYT
jgi:hypothetical protein